MDPELLPDYRTGMLILGAFCAIPIFAILCLIYAPIVMLASRYAARVNLSYGTAYKVAIFVAIISSIAPIVARGVCNSFNLSVAVEASISAPITFLMISYVYGCKIEHPEKGEIGFLKGMLVCLTVWVLIAVISFIIVGIGFLFLSLPA